MLIYPFIIPGLAYLFVRAGPPSPPSFEPEVPRRKKRRTPSEPSVPPVRRRKPPKRKRPKITPPKRKPRPKPKPKVYKPITPPTDPRLRISLAKELAGSVAREVRRKRYGYSRKITKDFQNIANIAVDGLYGGGTAGAVQYYTRMPPPRPIFKPFRIKKFIPKGKAPHMPTGPPKGVEKPIELSLLDATILLGNESAKNIRMRGKRYNKRLLKAFQKGANIVVDGLYGGGTAGAIQYYTKRTPPRPLYNPKKVRTFTPRGKAPRH